MRSMNKLTEELNALLKGKKITGIIGMQKDSEEITLQFEDGTTLMFFHNQDCCEVVEVAQVDGIVDRHIGTTFTELRVKVDGRRGDFNRDESETWTFYTLITSKGYLDFRWIGSSNGYYSEKVDTLVDIPEPGETK